MGLEEHLVAVVPRRYYQVRAVWFRERDDARWQIGRAESAETRRLVAQVREPWLKREGQREKHRRRNGKEARVFPISV